MVVVVILGISCLLSCARAWRQYAPIPTADDIISVAANPSASSLSAFTLSDAYRSQDSGVSWEKSTLGVPTTSFSHAKFCYSHSLQSYFGIIDSSILRSANGLNFSKVQDAGDSLISIHCNQGCTREGKCDYFFAIGSSSAFYSPDAQQFQKAALPSGVAITAVTVALPSVQEPEAYLAGGTDASADGSGRLFCGRGSPPTWAECTIPDVPTFLAVTASQDIVVAVGYFGIIATSTAGESLFSTYFINTTFPGVDPHIYDIGYYNSHFFACAAGPIVFASPNPSNPSLWVKINGPSSSSFLALAGISNGVILVGQSGSVALLESDASSWRIRALSQVVTTGDFDGISAGPVSPSLLGHESFADSADSTAIATVSGVARTIFVSRNGTGWTAYTIGVDAHNIAFVGQLWFGWIGMGQGLAVSLDGLTWKPAFAQPLLTPVLYLVENKTYYCITGADGALMARTSIDGHTWSDFGKIAVTRVQSPQFSSFAAHGLGQSLYFITYFDYSMNMSRSALISSTTGKNFSIVNQFSSFMQFYPQGLLYVAPWRLFVLAIDQSVYSSADGVAWAQHKLNASNIVSIAFGGEALVAITQGGDVWKAGPDLSAWRRVFSATNLPPYPGAYAAYVNDAWVLVGGKGVVYVGA